MNTLSTQPPTGIMGWFASNPVAANLLMLFILIGGLVSLKQIDQEVFPRFNPKQIEISVTYPGVGVQEIRASVCIPIEEAIRDVVGIKRLYTEISMGECAIKVLLLPDYATEPLINTLYGRIQSLSRLPKNIEKITVQPAIRNDDDGVIWVALHGAVDMLALQRYGQQIQTDLEQIPGVRLVRNYYELPYEMVVEVSSAKLRQYRLTLQEISDAIKQTSLDQSEGLIKAITGELQLRIKAKAQDAESLGKVVIRKQADGSRLLLSDVASIRDGLAERLSEWHHNGETAQGWEIHTQHSAVNVAKAVKQHIAQFQPQLAPGLALTTWWDDSQAYAERVDTLLEDGVAGFVLVCLVLTLFLRLRVAVWAGVGIFTSVMGALWLMPMLHISLNMLSLFGFLLAMGILVDDAIIIGESVYSQQAAVAVNPQAVQDFKQAHLAATISGVRAVALPVGLSVSVALVAFLPGLFLPGWAGQLMQPICWVMILTLVFSLIEALLILPAHLVNANIKPENSWLDRYRNRLNHALQHWIERTYRPFLTAAMTWQYLTLACFGILIMLCTVWVASGRIHTTIQADVVKDSFWVSLKTPQDMPYSEARTRAKQVEQAFFQLRDELDQRQLQKDGQQSSLVVGLETIVWEHGAGFWTEFSPTGRQTIRVEDFINQWRKRIGDLGRTKIDFLYKEGDVPYDLEFSLGSEDTELLAKAAEQLKTILGAYPGIYDITDSSEPGKPEMHLTLTPQAEALGISQQELSNQVRQAYFGEEVQRLQRGRNEVKVMLRYPLAERQSLATLQQMPIHLPNGQSAPLGTLAKLNLTPGIGKIIRQDRQRAINVQARVDTQKNDANALYAQLEAVELPKLRQHYPDITLNIGQERQDQQAMLSALWQNTLMALLMIYILIAVPFRSYLKPLIFLFSVPVAWCGAIIAHAIVGLPLSMESLVGMIAASGVVVNDSLVLLDYLKAHETEQTPIEELICNACIARFRPIFLAFLTNFAGFLPTLLETSEQAQFLIPMTLSLSAGLLLGMSASLILTPILYAFIRQKSCA